MGTSLLSNSYNLIHMMPPSTTDADTMAYRINQTKITHAQ